MSLQMDIHHGSTGVCIRTSHSPPSTSLHLHSSERMELQSLHFRSTTTSPSSEELSLEHLQVLVGLLNSSYSLENGTNW
jgi:hypothetical protein